MYRDTTQSKKEKQSKLKIQNNSMK